VGDRARLPTHPQPLPHGALWLGCTASTDGKNDATWARTPAATKRPTRKRCGRGSVVVRCFSQKHLSSDARFGLGSDNGHKACHLQLAIAANWSVSPRIRLRLLPMHPPRAAGMRPCTFHSGIHCESHCLTYSRRSLYRSKIITRALRAHRVIFMICVLHVSNALRPVTTRCGNPDLSPSFGYQDRQSIIPRRGKFRARPVVQVHIALAIRQLRKF
jgi:hypothetical protein